MPIPTEPKTSAALDTLVASIEAVQAADLAAGKPFWQGAKTKEDGTAKTPDHDSWEDKGITLGAIDEEVEVHTYDGPRGSGYIIIMEKPVTGGRYIKKVVNGPEQERASDWTFYPDE